MQMDRLSSPKTPDPFRWLTSEDAAPYLATAAEELSANSLVRLTAKLRKSLTAEQAHLVIEQVEMRRRAKEKFAAADRMFFTPKSLMQASDEVIAAYKAARVPAGARFADLC